MVKKSIIKPILNYKMPDSCIRIDDNYIEFIVNKLKINVVGVPYYNDNSWSCSLDKNIHDNHTPKWSELKSDHRPPMIQKCLYDFNNIN